MSDGDELFEFDLENIRQELDLMEAGSRRGCLCSGCGSITTVENQLLLMAIARVWLQHLPEFEELRAERAHTRKMVGEFTDGIRQVLPLLERGWSPFPTAPPPSVN